LKKNDPKISVFNRQRKVRIERRSLEAFLARLLERLELEGGCSVVLLSDRAMRGFNRRFAGKDYSTDVLSFPAGRVSGESYLGDVLISAEFADRQRKGDLATELQVLALHGVLHLIGYDHENDDGEMESFEGDLRREFELE
jgi:probable rRNA maturation factor